MKNNTTLLIQGPFHINSVLAIDTYLHYFDEIIYSTYSLSDQEKIIADKFNLHNKVVFVFNNLLDVHEKFHNKSNIAYQTLTTLGGLKQSTSTNILKVRSDEYFLGIHNFLEIRNKKSKAAFSNIFFRHPEDYPYHISDHIIFSNKNILTESFEKIWFYITANENIPMEFIKILNPYFNLKTALSLFVPEQLIALCMLHIIDKKLIIDLRKPQNNITLFLQYFDIIDIKTLKPYIVSATKENKRYFCDNIEDSPCFMNKDCNSMKDYIIRYDSF